MRDRAVFGLAVVVLLLCLSGPSRAQESGSVMSAEDRSATVSALQDIKRDQWSRAKSKIAGTHDPLAEKIFDWMAYTKGYGEPSFAKVTGFSDQNPNWPGQRRMRLAAENALDDNGVSDQSIIDWFDRHGPLTTDGMVVYLGALQRQGMEEKARLAARDWWATTLMTPDQQNRFLKNYKAYLDTDAHRRRLDKLLFSKNFTNARAVARILGRGYPALAEARIALVADDAGVNGRVSSVPANLASDPGLAYERLRWRRRNGKDVGALEILHNPPPADMITNLPDWWTERHIMARRLMEEGQFESAYLLVVKHQQKEGFSFAQAEFLAGWLALRHMKQPWRAFEHFEALYHGVVTPVSRSRGAYWAGLASEELGHPEVARQWYRAAARHQTTYYGQLALAELDDAYKPPQQLPPERSLESLNAFNRSEMVQVTRILHKAGLRQETTDFLDAMAEAIKKPEDYILVLDLAEELDHYHNAVRIAKKGLEKNIFLMDHAYPTMLTRMKGIDLEWALAHAVIRQESGFDYDAQSPAGARGLMQLMPATAAETAKKLGLTYRQDWLTQRPDYNIKLGSTYMQRMIARYDGSYPLAVAAYNGGPGRVDRWLKQFGDPRKGEIDVVDWVELLPVYETRNYVQRVLEGTYVYRIKLGGVQKSADAPIHVAYKKGR